RAHLHDAGGRALFFVPDEKMCLLPDASVCLSLSFEGGEVTRLVHGRAVGVVEGAGTWLELLDIRPLRESSATEARRRRLRREPRTAGRAHGNACTRRRAAPTRESWIRRRRAWSSARRARNSDLNLLPVVQGTRLEGGVGVERVPALHALQHLAVGTDHERDPIRMVSVLDAVCLRGRPLRVGGERDRQLRPLSEAHCAFKVGNGYAPLL